MRQVLPRPRRELLLMIWKLIYGALFVALLILTVATVMA